MEGERSRILRSSDWTGRNKDGEGKGKRSIGLANTKVCQECSEVLGIGELLLLIHLGLYNYSQTITQYGKKNQKWEWMERQEEAFRELKERFIKELVLVVPDLDKKMRMEVDVSDYVIGGVLSIKCKDER